jgi:hypothetical protein
MMFLAVDLVLTLIPTHLAFDDTIVLRQDAVDAIPGHPVLAVPNVS